MSRKPAAVKWVSEPGQHIAYVGMFTLLVWRREAGSWAWEVNDVPAYYGAPSVHQAKADAVAWALANAGHASRLNRPPVVYAVTDSKRCAFLANPGGAQFLVEPPPYLVSAAREMMNRVRDEAYKAAGLAPSVAENPTPTNPPCAGFAQFVAHVVTWTVARNKADSDAACEAAANYRDSRAAELVTQAAKVAEFDAAPVVAEAVTAVREAIEAGEFGHTDAASLRTHFADVFGDQLDSCHGFNMYRMAELPTLRALWDDMTAKAVAAILASPDTTPPASDAEENELPARHPADVATAASYETEAAQAAMVAENPEAYSAPWLVNPPALYQTLPAARRIAARAVTAGERPVALTSREQAAVRTLRAIRDDLERGAAYVGQHILPDVQCARMRAVAALDLLAR